MSHNAAFANTELIEDLVDNRSPLRNTASRFAMWCLGLLLQDSQSVNLYANGAAGLPVDGDKLQRQTLSHLVVETNRMANAIQSSGQNWEGVVHR